jgi:dethiobiotin synthetase
MTLDLFVTGTDTGVGKTTIGAALLAALHRRGERVAPCKAVETGCVPDRDPDDAALLAAAAHRPVDHDVCPYRFIRPVAPFVAARSEARPIELAPIREAWTRLGLNRPRLRLLEGAGGLLVPYTASMTGADLALTLGVHHCLVVARASLGTINHTTLTVLEARRRGLRVIGVIINRTVAEADDSEKENAAEIERLAETPVLATWPHLEAASRRDVGRLAELAERHLPIDRILAALAA